MSLGLGLEVGPAYGGNRERAVSLLSRCQITCGARTALIFSHAPTEISWTRKVTCLASKDNSENVRATRLGIEITSYLQLSEHRYSMILARVQWSGGECRVSN